MNNINATDPLNGLYSQAASQTANQNKDNKVGADTFLTLLVAQLKNQDPLNPQDGTQFVAQLAQFNSLEQLISINQRLGQVLDQPTTASDPAAVNKS
jgi:flagellar basal-body rod modification protein FlgD